jgi:hypothetical protein
MNVSSEAVALPVTAAWQRGSLAALVRGILGAIDTVARATLVIALLAELSVVLTDVSIRVLFTQSLLWTEEASKLSLTTLAFLGGALAYRARHHTAIEFVTQLFSLPVRQAASMPSSSAQPRSRSMPRRNCWKSPGFRRPRSFRSTPRGSCCPSRSA